MKTKFLKGAVMPLATFAVAIAGAFFTTSMAAPSALIDADGHYFVDEETPCMNAQVTCSTDWDPVVCTSGSNTLYRLTAPGICQQPLYIKR